MSTRFIAVIFILLFTVNSANSIERYNSKFREIVKKNIFREVKASGDKIGISAITKKANNEIIIYINSYDSYEAITCQQVEDFHLIKKPPASNSIKHRAQLKVGLCPNKESIGKDIIRNIETKISNVAMFDSLDKIKKKEFGLYIAKEDMSDGTTKIYYPGIIIGHGVGIIKSYIFFPKDNKYSLVIQYAPTDSQDINSPLFNTVNNNINSGDSIPI